MSTTKVGSAFMQELKQTYLILGMIALKLNERFKNIISAFRYFDTNHTMTLDIFEFAQGIEFLRIKINMDMVRKVFEFLDVECTGELSFDQFRQLDEENYRKLTIEKLA